MASFIVTQFLNCQSKDKEFRTKAKEIFTQGWTMIPQFFHILSHMLSNNAETLESRRSAGTVLKRNLDAKGWMAIDPDQKSIIKDELLKTLESSTLELWSEASQVIAKVAKIEVPLKQWPELFTKLCKNVKPGKSDSLKQASLETLELACREVSSHHLEKAEVKEILDVVLAGMDEMINFEVRLAATRALYYVLDFALRFIRVDDFSTYFTTIMNFIFKRCKDREAEIREAAYECLVPLASLYYNNLEPYRRLISDLTIDAIGNGEEAVALQSIEFWSTICDEELQRHKCRDMILFDFVNLAAKDLLPPLLNTLLKQEIDQFTYRGAWNVSMAGGTCLGLLARIAGENIVDDVMDFVRKHGNSQVKSEKDAAVFAFGSILVGLSSETFDKYFDLRQLNTLLVIAKNVEYLETVAWTLSRIFELFHSKISGFHDFSTILPKLVEVLKTDLQEVKRPRTAEQICGVIYFLAHGYKDAGSRPSTLSTHLSQLGDILIAIGCYKTSDFKSKTTALKTLPVLLSCWDITDKFNEIRSFCSKIICNLVSTTTRQRWSYDSEKTRGENVIALDETIRNVEDQTFLISALTEMIQNFGDHREFKNMIITDVKKFKSLFESVFVFRSQTVDEETKYKATSPYNETLIEFSIVSKEAMFAISTLSCIREASFDTFFSKYFRYMVTGLRDPAYCEVVMNHFFDMLSNIELSRKHLLLAYCGNLALEIGNSFHVYIPKILKVMKHALRGSIAMGWIDQLKLSIMEACSGIVLALTNQETPLVPYAKLFLELLELICRGILSDKILREAAVNALGHFVNALGEKAMTLLRNRPARIGVVDELVQITTLMLSQRLKRRKLEDVTIEIVNTTRHMYLEWLKDMNGMGIAQNQNG